MENNAHIIAVNCAGNDPYGPYYAGDSQLLNPEGETVVLCNEGKEDLRYGLITLRER